MKAVLISSWLFFSSLVTVDANDSDYSEIMVIDNSSQLNQWCESESSEYFLAEGLNPSNWTSSRWVDGEYLFVEGVWRVEGDKRNVECTVRKGVKEKYATWKLLEE